MFCKKKILILVLLIISLNLYNKDIKFYTWKSIDKIGPIFGEEFTMSSRITDLIFLPLLTSSNNFDIEPVILSEPLPRIEEGEIQADGRIRYILDLRSDIFWYDGYELTAWDVEFTYKVIKNDNVESINARSIIRNISSIRAINKYKIEIYFNQYKQNNFASLTFTILPKHKFKIEDPDNPYINATDSFFSENPLGCGMYKCEDFVPLSLVNLERNDNYLWKKSEFNEVKIRYTNTVANAVQRFIKDGEINLLPDTPVSSKQEIDAYSNLGIVQYYDFSWQYIAFNLRRSIFSDLDFRKALFLSVNKNNMNNSIFFGNATIIHGPFPATHSAVDRLYHPYDSIDWDKELDKDPIRKANEILDEIGYLDNDGDGYRERNGKRIQLNFVYLNGIPDNKRIVTSIYNYFKNINIDVITKPVEIEEYKRMVYIERDFDLVLDSFSFGSDPNISTLFKSDEDKSMGNNICGFKNKEVDALFEEADNKPNTEQKFALYRKQFRIIADQFPAIFLWQKPRYIAYDKNQITGLEQDTIDRMSLFKNINLW